MAEITHIRNLKPGQKDLSLMFIVLEVNRPTKTKEGHEVRTVKVADRTAAVNLSVWDDLGKLIQSGDIIKMNKGYVNMWKNCLTLYMGKGSDFIKIGEFCLVFTEIPFMSEPNAEFLGNQLPIDRGPNAHGGASGVGGGGGGGGGASGPNKNMFRGGGERGPRGGGHSATPSNGGAKWAPNARPPPNSSALPKDKLR